MRCIKFWGFEIEIDPLIPARRPDQVVINKKEENLPYCRLYHPSRTQNENQRKQKERKILKPCQRTKEAVEHKSDGDTNCN